MSPFCVLRNPTVSSTNELHLFQFMTRELIEQVGTVVLQMQRFVLMLQTWLETNFGVSHDASVNLNLCCDNCRGSCPSPQSNTTTADGLQTLKNEKPSDCMRSKRSTCICCSSTLSWKTILLPIQSLPMLIRICQFNLLVTYVKREKWQSLMISVNGWT